MKRLKEIISIIVFLVFLVSAVFNVLFLFKKISASLLYTGFFIVVLIIFLVSVLGIIIKNIKQDEYVKINILTPAKEFGILYAGLLVIWAVTYFITIIFK